MRFHCIFVTELLHKRVLLLIQLHAQIPDRHQIGLGAVSLIGLLSQLRLHISDALR